MIFAWNVYVTKCVALKAGERPGPTLIAPWSTSSTATSDIHLKMVFEPMAPVWLNFHLRRQDGSIESSKSRRKERLVDDSSPSLVAISKKVLEFLESDKTETLSRSSEGEKSGFWTTLLLLISKSHLTWTLIHFLWKRPIFVLFADVKMTENKLFISSYTTKHTLSDIVAQPILEM